jgi:N-acyl amino acid synthase of PEP-CTERM/exosortase system
MEEGSGSDWARTGPIRPVQASERFTFLRVVEGDDALPEILRFRSDAYGEVGRSLQAGAPSSQPRDEWDATAVHIVARNEVGKLIATLRLVADSPQGFPIESYKPTWFPFFYSLNRARIVEVTHLIVAKEYRGAKGFGTLSPRGSALAAPVYYPRLLLGLFRLLFIECIHQRHDLLLVAMEEPVWRLLKRFGFEFEPIGQPLRYYGRVMPYFARVDDLLRLMARRVEILRYTIAGEPPA